MNDFRRVHAVEGQNVGVDVGDLLLGERTGTSWPAARSFPTSCSFNSNPPWSAATPTRWTVFVNPVGGSSLVCLLMLLQCLRLDAVEDFFGMGYVIHGAILFLFLLCS